jgi:hypothetical protein
MKEGVIHLVDLDFEYKIWKNRLEGFLKDLKIIRKRNQSIESGQGAPELNAVELMILDEHEAQLQKMMGRLVVQEQELQFYNKDFPITPLHQYITEHMELRDRMERLTQSFQAKMTDLVEALRI